MTGFLKAIFTSSVSVFSNVFKYREVIYFFLFSKKLENISRVLTRYLPWFRKVIPRRINWRRCPRRRPRKFLAYGWVSFDLRVVCNKVENATYPPLRLPSLFPLRSIGMGIIFELNLIALTFIIFWHFLFIFDPTQTLLPKHRTQDIVSEKEREREHTRTRCTFAHPMRLYSGSNFVAVVTYAGFLYVTLARCRLLGTTSPQLLPYFSSIGKIQSCVTKGASRRFNGYKNTFMNRVLAHPK